MPTYDPTAEARAVRELKRQRAKLNADKDAVTAARDALHEAIVRHLTERHAAPGAVADHTPYDRNHVGVLARNAGVKPLRAKGQPAEVPVYDDEVAATTLAELDQLTAEFTKAGEREKKTHAALQAAATQHYVDGHASAQTIADASEFDRNTVMRWGRESRKAAAAG
ncbi:hypothetical protein [Streptomyces sp. NPDC001068]|uniref:hypothetical protein n=1 Tax=Streptomyces sp. NPDC001068 TaxID=3364544 RepID=UPI00367450A5